MHKQLMAWTADGGIPLFTRKHPNDKNIPFALLGTIAGLNLFATAHNSQLINTTTQNGEKITWKIYHDSVLLVLITWKSGVTDCYIDYLMDTIFNAMVMAVGLEALQNITNVERLKRDLKVSYTVIDFLLFNEDSFMIADLVGAYERIISKETASFQSYLESFITGSAESMFGCLLVGTEGRVVVASKRWWTLPPAELTLLPLFVASQPKATAQEMSLYLPISCPTMCNRLVKFQLTQDASLCVLWGNSTPLSVIEEEVPKCWKGAYEQLKQTAALQPRNFPLSISTDHNILGILLVNREKHHCLYSFNPSQEEPSYKQRHSWFRDIYQMLQEDYLPYNSLYPRTSQENVSNKVPPPEAYYCLERHTFYFVSDSTYHILVLFSPSVPRYAMRKVTHNTIKSLTTFKHCPL